MRKKGFTLIELLAVIVILGILLSISIVAVNSIRKKQEKENLENVISSILTGAKRYFADNPSEIKNNEYKEIATVQNLFNGDYVDFDQDKYSSLLRENVYAEICSTTTTTTSDYLKLRYFYTYDGKTYEDSGCDKQGSGSSEKSKFLKTTTTSTTTSSS